MQKETLILLEILAENLETIYNKIINCQNSNKLLKLKERKDIIINVFKKYGININDKYEINAIDIKSKIYGFNYI